MEAERCPSMGALGGPGMEALEGPGIGALEGPGVEARGFPGMGRRGCPWDIQETSGMVLTGRTSSGCIRYDATRYMHLQVLMHVHPGVHPRCRSSKARLRRVNWSNLPRRKDITWTWWLRTPLTTLGSTA